MKQAQHPARILLINPGMNIPESFGDFAGLMEPMPCIGIAYLAASLRHAGHLVRCIDNFTLNLPYDALLKEVEDFRAEFVGQSCLTPTAAVSFEFNKLLKEAHPEIHTILGNVHASVFAKEIIEGKQADYILEGECEYSLPMLLDQIKGNSTLDNIPGLHYTDPVSNKYTFSGPPEPIKDLDALPRPDWSDLPWERYTFLPFVTIAKPAVAIMGSRGCPCHCTFCALGYQGRYRVRSPEGIVEEMDILVKDFRAKHIGFVDPIFPLYKDHLFQLCELIRNRHYPKYVTWTSETRIDSLDREMMQEMKSAGVRRLLFGVESGVNRLLKIVRKNYTVDQVKKTMQMAKEVGLETSCFFILGLPTETRQESLRTASFPIELNIDFAKFSILIPLPGSKLFNDLVESGRISSGSWDKFVTFNPSPSDLPYVPEGMTGEELLALQKAANMKFYFRPRIILRHLFVIRTIPYKSILIGVLIWLRWQKMKAIRALFPAKET